MVKEYEAQYYDKVGDGKVVCRLCPHNCTIPPGGRGRCGIRINESGKLIAAGYGIYPAVHLDPIEKKPLNHFMPGNRILSLGSVGCNLSCLFCQNWSLSCDRPDGMENYLLPPDVLVDNSLSGGSIGASFTYNEPTINYEYLMEVTPALKEAGARIVYVTNGHLSSDPWKDLMRYADAANIDVKSFSKDFYRKIAGGDLETVLENVLTSFGMGVHIELTYLVIPDHNDDPAETGAFIGWVKDELSKDVPVHFNRFHPDHKMTDVPPTPASTLERIRDQAIGKGLRYVYVGNIWGPGLNDTRCPKCGKRVVKRDGYTVRVGAVSGKCPKCGEGIAGVWE